MVHFEQAFLEWGRQLPPRPLEHSHFTRWGKNNCHSAMLIGDGVYLYDFSTGEKLLWFPKGNAEHQTPEKQKERREAMEKAKQQIRNEIESRQAEAASQALTIWNKAQDVTHHIYLQVKHVESFGLRQYGSSLLIPLYDIGGNLCSLQYINPSVKPPKKFLPGGRKKGCFHTIGTLANGKAFFVVEGYATGASIHMATGAPVVVAFDAGNLEPVIAALRTVYPDSLITIAADNDQWGEVNTGKLKAEEAASKHGCKVVLPEFSDTIKKECEAKEIALPTDWNDLHVLAGLDEVRRQLLGNTEPPKPGLPLHFFQNKKGLYFHQKDGDPKWICSPIETVCYTRDENNENWGVLVRFKDRDNYIHERAIPMELLKGDCTDLYGLFLSLGLSITPVSADRKKLPEFLQSVKLPKRAMCTPRIGWYSDYFVLPGGAIPATDTVYLQAESSNHVGFRTSGTLQEWQEHIAAPCAGNSRLVFSLSCAFAAPLLPLLHAESGGFNLKGASSIGKSTALSVAASVWGSPKFIQQWKATGNALEAVAESYNNALLPLDELGQVDGKEAGEVAYMLANGCGKSRSKASGGLRKKLEWNLLFLSTGEISIADKMNEAGKKVQAGMLTRMADIPADANKGHKLFDTLNGFKDGNALANHFKDSTSRYYGTAIREFLPHLPGIKSALPDIVKQVENDFSAKYVSKDADGQVQRVAGRFVLVAAAGELAIKLGILPYRLGEAFRASGECFTAWLEARGSSGSHETEEAIKQVQNFIEANYSSRFATMGEQTNDTAEKIINQAGFKRRINDSWEFFVFTTVFQKEICKGFDPGMVCKELCERNILIRGNARQYIKKQNLPIGQKKIYHLTPAILAEGNE